MSVAATKTEPDFKDNGVKHNLFDQFIPLSSQLPVPQPIAATLDKAGIIALDRDPASAN